MGREREGLEPAVAVHDAEDPVAAVGLEPVAPGALHVAHADGKLVDASHRVEHDRAVADHGPEHPEAPRGERVQEVLQVAPREPRLVPLRGIHARPPRSG